MTLLEIAELACDKVGKSDDSFVALAKRFAQRRWEMIWNAHLWRESLALVSASTYVGYTTLLLPSPIERVLKVRAGSTRTIGVEHAETVFDFDADVWEEAGDPMQFVLQTPACGYNAAGFVNSTISFTYTDNALDYGKKVVVKGEKTDGSHVESSHTIDSDGGGLSPSVSMVFVLSVSKPVTEESIAINLNSLSLAGGAAYLRPLETTMPRYARIRLLPRPTSATCLVLGKRFCPLLSEDGSQPLLLGVDNALLAFVEGDLLQRLRQYAKSQLKVQEAQAHMASLIAQETNQQAWNARIIPSEEIDPIGRGFGFTSKTHW